MDFEVCTFGAVISADFGGGIAPCAEVVLPPAQPQWFSGTLPSKHSPYPEISAFGCFLDWGRRGCGRTVFFLFCAGLLPVLLSPRFCYLAGMLERLGGALHRNLSSI